MAIHVLAVENVRKWRRLTCWPLRECESGGDSRVGLRESAKVAPTHVLAVECESGGDSRVGRRECESGGDSRVGRRESAKVAATHVLTVERVRKW